MQWILYGNLLLCWFLFPSLQQSDETPMVWEILLYMYVLYSPDWHYRSTMPTFLFLYGAAFAVVHFFARFQVVFKLHYFGLCLLCIPRMYKYYIQTKDMAAKRLAKLWVLTLTLGTLCWLVDRICCKKLSHWYVNPQGHAWWHVLTGLNSYYANTFLMFCRAQQRGWEPRITHLLGFLPYVKVQKPEKREWFLFVLNTDAIQSATSKLMASNVRRQVVAFLYMGIQMITDYKCSDVTLDFGNLNWHLFCTIFNRGTEISWSAGVLVLPIFPLVLCSCLLVLIGLSLIYLFVRRWMESSCIS